MLIKSYFCNIKMNPLNFFFCLYFIHNKIAYEVHWTSISYSNIIFIFQF